MRAIPTAESVAVLLRGSPLACCQRQAHPYKGSGKGTEKMANEPEPAPDERALPGPREDTAASHAELPSDPGTAVWARIRKHKVVEWTLAYIAFAFALVHGVQLVREAFEWPALLSRLTIIALVLGTPVAATLAWYHGHRARHRVSGSELAVLTVLLVIAGSTLWFFASVARERSESPQSGANTVPAPPLATTGVSAAFAPPAHSIAVLPFTNLSGDTKQEYFSDGLSEELLNALSRIDALQVVARTSSFAFKGRQIDVGTIARQLNVGAVLEGSVRRSGTTLRITAQLVNGVTGFHLWSQTYDRRLDDVLVVQTEVATAVAQQLQAKLLGDEVAKIELGGTRNPQAYDAYLRGSRIFQAEEPEQAQPALAALDEAVALDQTYARAHATRARVLTDIAFYTAPNRQKLLNEALTAANRAIQLAPELAEAHNSLAHVLEQQLDFQRADLEHARALALGPGSAIVQRSFASFASAMGRHELAIATARRAVELDSLNYWSHLNLGTVLTAARRYREALLALNVAKEVKPDEFEADAYRGFVYLAMGEAEQARLACANGRDEPIVHWCLTLVWHALGKPSESDAEREKWLRRMGDAGAFFTAEMYVQLGDPAEGLRWLKVAERLRDPSLINAKVYWILDPIRDQPEFKALLQRLNFPP